MNEATQVVLWQIPHVLFVRLDTGNYCLIVEGIEVNDYVEDHLWDDYEYSATNVSMDGPRSVPVYYNYLPADLPLEPFLEALGGLDAEVADKIFRMSH
ncbi:MAG: hypothetical protein EOO11_13200 [Chitinophagaceae bacterium]|nr:MAG: hypothetical protein EOO11_13200 [Chitinophagaceae bacterium]